MESDFARFARSVRVGLGCAAGAAIAYVDNVAFEGEVSPIVIVALLLATSATAGTLWGRGGWLAAGAAWVWVPLSHVVKHLLGLRDTLQPNTYGSIASLAAFSLGVAIAGTGFGMLLRRLAAGPGTRGHDQPSAATRHPKMDVTPTTALRLIRLVHTVVWALFVVIIFAIPVAAWYRRSGLFLVLTGLVLIEVVVLAVNGMRCPLTGVAARYTEDRAPNFDIYLPRAIARYNKEIFGTLFLAGVAFGLWRALA